jgi:hypothetical protein
MRCLVVFGLSQYGLSMLKSLAATGLQGNQTHVRPRLFLDLHIYVM